MKDNNYKYTLLTGKYLPDENIISEDNYMFFNQYDNQGKETYYEDSKGIWAKTEYNEQGKEIYFETSKCYWEKKEYNSQGIMIYYENSSRGILLDER